MSFQVPNGLFKGLKQWLPVPKEILATQIRFCQVLKYGKLIVAPHKVCRCIDGAQINFMAWTA